MQANQFCDVLQIPAMADAAKRERVMYARIVGLGFGATCARCGGCGQYSYCQMHGTTCFGCGGSGIVAPKLTGKLLANIAAVVAEGKLDTYLADMKRKRELRNAAKSAVTSVMSAWESTGVSKAYDWRKASGADANPYDREIANSINAPMYELFNAVQNLAGKCDEFAYLFRLRSVKSTDERAAVDAEFDSMRSDLATLAADAISRINELAALMPEIQEKYAARAA